MAAHALPSPVWVNYDPAWETNSYPSDWEYYSDEYWENGSSPKRKREENQKVAEKNSNKTKYSGKKRRKTDLAEATDLSFGEHKLAAGGVIWKSKEEILKAQDGPQIVERKLEKVSLFKDWRERFKPSKSSISKFEGRKSSLVSELELEEDDLREEDDAGVLPPPPMSLQESPGLPSRTRSTIKPLKEPPLATYVASSFPTYDDDLDPGEDSLEETPGTEVNISINKINELNQSVRDAEILDPPQKKPGRPRKQPSIKANKEQGKLDSRTAIKVIVPSTKESPSRSQAQSSLEVINGGDVGNDSQNVGQSSTNRGKRKAEDELLDSGTPNDLLQKRKRGRPKQQAIASTSHPSVKDGTEISELVTTSGETRKSAGPEKQRSLPSNIEVAQNDPQDSRGSNDKKLKSEPLRDRSVHTSAINGVDLARKKRRVESSEDELSKPIPKRQNSSKTGPKAKVDDSTNENGSMT